MMLSLLRITGQRSWKEKSEDAGTIITKVEKACKYYSLTDVACHCSPDDCWVVIGHNVYDVTHFAQEHPGGRDIILENAGRDATMPFYGAGHSKDAFNLLEQYLVGKLVENERLHLFD